MVKFVKTVIVLYLSGCIIACSHTNSKPLLIDFSKDGGTIEISNIDPAGLLQLKNSEQTDTTSYKTVFVMQTPSEGDSLIKELPIQGSVKVTDTNVVFIPLQPFVKGREYRVTTYLNANFGDPEKMVKGKLSYGLKPNQKTLRR
jgi:hypothetical protein